MAPKQTVPPPAAPAPAAPPGLPTSAPAARAQLIHIEVDRRLGHEWDEWNGRPLPKGGDFSAPPRLFFGYAALTVATVSGVVALLLYLIGPRLGRLWGPLPQALWIALAAVAGLPVVFLGLPAGAFFSRPKPFSLAFLGRWR